MTFLAAATSVSAQLSDPLASYVLQLEVGKTYIFENALNNSYKKPYLYLCDIEAGEALKSSEKISENCLWIAEAGSTDGTVYLKNKVTGGYLFANISRSIRS